MKKFMSVLMIAVLALAIIVALTGCDAQPTSDETQRVQQEKILSEGSSQVGMPAIKNFRERKLLKDILEMRDQSGLITYTYVENQIPTVKPGVTIMGGKFTYVGESVGYGLPYATQFTNPEKVEYSSTKGYVTMPQADPNGLFSPSSASGTWVLLKNPNGPETKPVYMEPNVFVAPWKYAFDK